MKKKKKNSLKVVQHDSCLLTDKIGYYINDENFLLSAVFLFVGIFHRY